MNQNHLMYHREEDKKDIKFDYLKSLFDPEIWDVGVISGDQLLEVSLKPIKTKAHIYGQDYTNKIHFPPLTNCLILAHSGHMWDYTHYDKACEILNNQTNLFKKWFPVYTNFKEAALRAGLGVRARNSLIYNYRFGFDVHYAAIGIIDNIIDCPTDRYHNKEIWNRCIGCDDCMNHCPVKAIRNKDDPPWINSPACDDQIGLGSPENPHIPSVKDFWHEHVHPEIPKEVVDRIWSREEMRKELGVTEFPFDNNGYTFDGQVIRKDGDAVNVPLCRECTSQPRCSKWKGRFPYERFTGKINDITLRELERNRND